MKIEKGKVLYRTVGPFKQDVSADMQRVPVRAARLWSSAPEARDLIQYLVIQLQKTLMLIVSLMFL
jgi:hypothetical protein